jgi:O-antigen/teichoic acid export membrane protein
MLAGNIASGLIMFLSIIYVARVLGAANFGLFQFVQAFLLYLVIIVDSGLSTYGIREIARNHERAGALSINIFALRLILATITYCLAILILLVVPMPIKLRQLFSLTFLLVFYRAINTDWVFQGLEKMKYVGLGKIIFAATTFILTVFLVKLPTDLLFVPLIQFIAGCLISLSFIIFLFKRILTFNLKQVSPSSWPATFLFAIPLGISTILLQIYDNLDTIMLGLMSQPSEVGYYNAAYRIFYLFAGVFSLWLATVLPVVCNKMAEDRDKTKLFMEKYLRLTLLIFIPLTLLVFLAAPLFIQIVFGQQYLQAIPALQWLIWALIPFVISNSYGSLILIPAGMFNLFLLSVGAGALANIVLNFLLIPKYGFIGAAIATIIAQAIAGMYAFHCSQKVLNLDLIRYLIKPLAIVLLAAGTFLLTHNLLAGQWQIMQLLVSNIISLGVASLLIVYLEYDFIYRFIKEIIRI